MYTVITLQMRVGSGCGAKNGERIGHFVSALTDTRTARNHNIGFQEKLPLFFPPKRGRSG
jgi:hypothetical protein